MLAAPKYCDICKLDKMFLTDGICDECRWEREEVKLLTPDNDTTTEKFVRMDTVESRPVRWLWQGRVPLGVATLIAGIPGQGKSHVTLDLAAKITKGELPGYFQNTPSSVVVMSREDMLEETISPRLQAAGADRSRVFALPFTAGSFDVDVDMPELEELVQQHHVRLVILDPLLAFTGSDGFKEAEVRRMLAPAQRLASQYRLALLGIMHLNKDVMQDVLSRVTHSQAFTALVRSVLFVGADPDDDEDEPNPSRILAHGKSNLSRLQPSLSFELEETVVMGKDEDGNETAIAATAVNWLGESEITAEQLVRGRGSGGTKLEQAKGLLLRFLGGANAVGKMTLVAEAERLGISEPTLRRAYRDLGGLDSDQERDPETGQMGSTMWRLPRSDRWSP